MGRAEAGILDMRLWTLHPKYLDRQGLVAVWREGLLAQAVLHSNTKGYKNHPQLDRFRNIPIRSRLLHIIYKSFLKKQKQGDTISMLPRLGQQGIPRKSGRPQGKWNSKSSTYSEN